MGPDADRGEMKDAYKILFRKHEGKRHRCDDNIEINFKESEWLDLKWIHVALDRDHWWAFVIIVVNLWIP